jgi:hypothetical protein
VPGLLLQPAFQLFLPGWRQLAQLAPGGKPGSPEYSTDFFVCNFFLHGVDPWFCNKEYRSRLNFTWAGKIF